MDLTREMLNLPGSIFEISILILYDKFCCRIGGILSHNAYRNLQPSAALVFEHGSSEGQQALLEAQWN